MQKKNAHLLIIEDNPRFLNEILQWLQDEFGYSEIATAVSVMDAEKKLLNPCDVVISDMRMEQDDSGFTILEYVKNNNLSAVVIILTANDTVVDCRRAFREGAWDYISKNMEGNCFETLDNSIEDAINYLNRWGVRQNEQWFEENRDGIEATYWGQWIAIINRSIIESADNERELLKLLEERKLRRLTTTIKKVGDLRPIIELISLGESENLEFKSTLQWDIKLSQENKQLQLSCLKTIAAFLNSEGGVLLIGVQDDGTVFGLQKDLETLKNGSLDKFERHLSQLIENHIGLRFLPYIKFRFDNFDGKDICGIYVRKAEQKAFLKSDKGLEVYVRTGNSSRTLSMSEIYEYFTSR